MPLKRSNDRKTTNLSNKAGTQSAIKNAFGLPAGVEYSCPGATSDCESVCYAGKLEKIFPGVRAVTTHNLAELQGKSVEQMSELLSDMIDEFVADCNKKSAYPAFRIHWDGDFFSVDYAKAWSIVIRKFAGVEFWAYTRSFIPSVNVVPELAGIPNLSLYLSVDSVNYSYAVSLVRRYPSVKIAALSDTMDNARTVIESVRGVDSKPGAKCPELIGAIPLISVNGGACFSCQLCPKGKADIRFASTGS